MRIAEECVDQAKNLDDPKALAYYQATLANAAALDSDRAGMSLARLGDCDAAQEHLHHALEVHGLDRRRTRAIVLADLGTVHLRQGDMDGALASWNEFVDCADGIRSVKVQDAAQDIRARLSRHSAVTGADELDVRLAALES